MEDPLQGLEALGWEDLMLDDVPLQVLPNLLLIAKWQGAELDWICQGPLWARTICSVWRRILFATLVT